VVLIKDRIVCDEPEYESGYHHVLKLYPGLCRAFDLVFFVFFNIKLEKIFGYSFNFFYFVLFIE